MVVEPPATVTAQEPSPLLQLWNSLKHNLLFLDLPFVVVSVVQWVRDIICVQTQLSVDIILLAEQAKPGKQQRKPDLNGCLAAPQRSQAELKQFECGRESLGDKRWRKVVQAQVPQLKTCQVQRHHPTAGCQSGETRETIRTEAESRGRGRVFPV
jgi:hypothetical protein